MADQKVDFKMVPASKPVPPVILGSAEVKTLTAAEAYLKKPNLYDLREKVADHLNRMLKSDSSKERAHLALAILDLFSE